MTCLVINPKVISTEWYYFLIEDFGRVFLSEDGEFQIIFDGGRTLYYTWGYDDDGDVRITQARTVMSSPSVLIPHGSHIGILLLLPPELPH